MSSWSARFGLLLLSSSPGWASPIACTLRTQIQESIANFTDTFGGFASYLVKEPADVPGAGARVVWQVSPTGDVTVFPTHPYSLSSGIFVRSGFEWYRGEGIDAGHLAGAVAIYNSIGRPATFAGRIDALTLAFAPASLGPIGGDLPGMAMDDLSSGWLSDLTAEDTFEEYYRGFVPSAFETGSGLFVTGE